MELVESIINGKSVRDAINYDYLVAIYQKIHGDYPTDFGKVGWRVLKEQVENFEVASQLFQGKKNPEVLDVGCGLGAFHAWMKEAGMDPLYTGIDIVPEYVQKCKDQGLSVYESSLDQFDRAAEYVVALGTFHYTEDEVERGTMTEVAKKLITQIWEMSQKGVAFTFCINPPHPEYLTVNEDEIKEFVNKLSDNNQFVHSDNGIELIGIIHESTEQKRSNLL